MANGPGASAGYQGAHTKPKGEVMNETCQWFALCANPADGVVRHPVLGDVPTCKRCAQKLDLDLVEEGS
jgi:hypothetical protein